MRKRKREIPIYLHKMHLKYYFKYYERDAVIHITPIILQFSSSSEKNLNPLRLVKIFSINNKYIR